MSTTQSLEGVISYLENLAARYTPLQHFGFGYADEQGAGGRTPYPQLFLEAEMEVTESGQGLNSYTAALLILDKPDQQGTQPGTRAERAILDSTKQYADELLEQMREEGQVRSVQMRSMLSLVEFGNDSAYGWRIEITFEAVKSINREEMKTRFTPLV